MRKSCKELRADARYALGGKFWYGVGMCLLASLLIGIAGGIGTFISSAGGDEVSAQMLGSLVSVAAVLFVSAPISIGLIRYFIKASTGAPDMSDMFYPYKSNLMNVVIATLKQIIFVFLWSLLFIIPGIVKGYSYAMVDYLIAENPNLDSSRAFEISKTAMNGNKGRLFLLQLSFIGWMLLACFTFGIGYILLAPYMSAAQVEFYKDVKAEAIDRGIMTEADTASYYNTQN